MKEQAINESDQRRALSPNSLFCHPKVRYCGDSGDAADHSAFAEAEGRTSLPFFRHGKQPDCLSMRSNQVDAVEGNIMFGTEILHSVPKHGSELDIELRHLGRGGFGLPEHGKDWLLNPLRDFDFIVLF